MDLQDNLDALQSDGVEPYEISYDPVETLSGFADEHGITYPLLSDVDNGVITDFGILNTLVPEGHRWYGVPFPGTYTTDVNGIIRSRTFYANHAVRDSIARMA
ncbi:TPA: hypothetical protein DCE37_14200 [Candidatus Latescibacteria bacterium]|nr:hypothetical protein [Candidatus Latescibacterota bacterium]